MAYIIENANILKDSRITTCSLLIQENRITGIQSSLFKHYRFMKMNLEEFVVTPTYCLLNSAISPNDPFPIFKQNIIEQFLLKGCTTLLTYVSVSRENELTEKFNVLRAAFMSSPIDFVIGARIPVRLLTESFIRRCKKELIPAIFVEVEDLGELKKLPWGWLRNSLFPYNCPLIPIIFPSLKQDKTSVLAQWKKIMKTEKIPSLSHEIEENQPLSKSELNTIGLYPLKSSLLNGTEVSYNLYFKSKEIKNVDEMSLFHYYGDRLAVTVHKGKIIRSGNEILFKPGYGEHVKVRTPAFFSL